MPWGVAVAAVVGYAGAQQQAGAAEDGANAQLQGQREATAEQRRQFDITNANFEPFRQAGIGALGRQEDILGGDYSGFMDSPDYLYARGQMQQGVERGAAARGSLYSGGTNVDLGNALNGIASQNLNNYWAKLAGQAGQGYNATNAVAGFGQNAANQIGANAMAAGQARASQYAQQANAWSNYGQQLSGMAGQYAGQNSGGGGWGWGGV